MEAHESFFLPAARQTFAPLPLHTAPFVGCCYFFFALKREFTLQGSVICVLKKTMAAAPTVRLLRLSGFPLLQQLWLEESLFRAHPGNWLVINDGVALPTVVLGISG